MTFREKKWFIKILFLTSILTFGLVLTLLLVVFIGAPLVSYLFSDLPYQVLSWQKIKRLLLLMPLLGFVIASVLTLQN